MKNRFVGVIKWLVALGVIWALMPLGYSFGDENAYDEWQTPPGQPQQMSSQVHCDPKLSDPFFKSDAWSYPRWIKEHPDGHFTVRGTLDKEVVKDPPRLKHTAECFSTSFNVEHLIRFCEARLVVGGMIDLLIHEKNPAFRDSLLVRIRNGKFTCQYWITDDFGAVRWTTTRQKLTVDKTEFRKGDLIKGRIDFECSQQFINPKDIEIWSKGPINNVKVFGVFRTTVE